MAKTNKKKDKPYEVDTDGTKYWYKNGKLHREDGPAIERADGTKYWYQHGQYHREDGPAIEQADGAKKWFQHGELHRDDGPAIEYPDGTKNWFKNGKLHREDGPAIEYPDGTKKWFQNGEYHREDGPAVEGANGAKYWYKNGKICEPLALKQMVKTNKKKLFRVDATLSYLVVTEKDIYTVKDFLAWAKNDMHSGELDESSALEIKEVKSTEQIQDYIDRDHDYMVYDNTNSEDDQYLSSLIKELGLDSEVIAAHLRELGYTVIPPTTKRTVNKPKNKKKTNG